MDPLIFKTLWKLRQASNFRGAIQKKATKLQNAGINYINVQVNPKYKLV